MKEKAHELRELTGEQLDQRLRECREKLVNFRMQTTTGTVDNVRAARATRRDIARIHTIQREREMQAAKEAN